MPRKPWPNDIPPPVYQNVEIGQRWQHQERLARPDLGYGYARVIAQSPSAVTVFFEFEKKEATYPRDQFYLVFRQV